MRWWGFRNTPRDERGAGVVVEFLCVPLASVLVYVLLCYFVRARPEETGRTMSPASFFCCLSYYSVCASSQNSSNKTAATRPTAHLYNATATGSVCLRCACVSCCRGVARARPAFNESVHDLKKKQVSRS